MMAAAQSPAGDSLAALLTGVAEIPAELDRAVTELTFDSREVTGGSVFFARRGARVDAVAFADQARARGAVAMVLEGGGAPRLDAKGLLIVPVANVTRAAGHAAHRFFACVSERLAVIAVTGTNGKTSVCHFVADALETQLGRPVGVLGTLGQRLGRTLHDTGFTTPDCIAVHRAMHGFASAGASVAVMEASSHALVQERLSGLRVRTAVFTNLSRDHLDYHGDMDAYGRAKALLFGVPGLETAVINAEDAAACHMRAAVGPDTRVVDFTLDGHSPAAVRGRVLRADAAGLEVAVESGEGRVHIASRLIGRPAAWNLLAAYCVLLAYGVERDRAAWLLSQARPVPGRMEALGGGDAPLAVIDYAHTPAALSAALDALRALCDGRLWCVFGAGGERDPGKRPLMGEAAAAADRIVITDDNPRGEDGDAIVSQILEGVPQSRRSGVHVERDRARAIALALGEARPGDVVLVAGKGHEAYQEVAGVRRAFSDAAAVRTSLRSRPR